MRRRAWLQGTTALGAIAASGLGLGTTGCGDPGAATALVLDVEPTRALIVAWSATARGATATLTAAGVAVGHWDLELGDDGTGWVDVTGLAPATAYVARIATVDGYQLGDFAFTTAPVDDEARAVRIAVSADVDESDDYASPIFTTAARDAPDLFVSLGDWPYADNGPSAITRADYHAKQVLTRLAPRVQPWLRASSFRAIYDDHEFANDWDGAARAADPARHQAALTAWDAWFPRRAPGPRYQRWRWGALVECFLLDCRAYRSANDAPDLNGKTLLGATQLAWLLDGLATSTATFVVVFTTVPLDYGHVGDHWSSFTHERAILFDAVRALARPVLFVSGDQHWFAAHVHAGGIREFQTGPLARGLIVPPADPPPGVLTRVSQYNYGVLEIDATPRLVFRAVGADGTTLYREEFSPADLTPLSRRSATPTPR